MASICMCCHATTITCDVMGASNGQPVLFPILGETRRFEFLPTPQITQKIRLSANQWRIQRACISSSGRKSIVPCANDVVSAVSKNSSRLSTMVTSARQRKSILPRQRSFERPSHTSLTLFQPHFTILPSFSHLFAGHTVHV